MSTAPAAFTVKTDPEHRDVFDALARTRGLNRQQFIALAMAQVCGLDRPTMHPAVDLDLDALRVEGAQVYDELQHGEGEVLRRSA